MLGARRDEEVSGTENTGVLRESPAVIGSEGVNFSRVFSVSNSLSHRISPPADGASSEDGQENRTLEMLAATSPPDLVQPADVFSLQKRQQGTTSLLLKLRM